MAVTALAALAYYSTTTAVLATSWAAYASFAGMMAAMAVSAVGRAVMSEKSSRDSTDAKTMIRSAVAPRNTVYGRTRVSGPILYAASTGTNHKYLHLVVALAGHEIDAVEEIWFGDKLVTLDANGYTASEPFGSFKRDAEMTNNGVSNDENGWAVSTLVPLARTLNAEATVGEHTATISVPSGYELAAINSVHGEWLSYGFDGAMTSSLAITFTTDGNTVHYTVPASPAFTRVVVTYQLNKVTITPFARVKIHLGAADQAVDADLLAECGGEGWTSEHRLRGIAYLYVRLEFNTNVYVSGIPNISAVIRGKKVFDPRTGQTAWSRNWALIMRDWLMSSDGLGVTSAEIDDAVIVTSANFSYFPLALPDATTHPRYTIDASISSDDRPIDTLGKLLAAGAGSMVYTQGKYVVRCGMAAPVSSHAITAGDLRGAVKVQPRPSRANLCNGAKAIYVNPADRYQQAETSPFSVPEYIAEDGGESIIVDLTFDYTTNPYIARHLAIVHVKRSRQGIVVEAPLKLCGFRYYVGQIVPITIPQLGWTEKAFRVSNWKLATDGRGVDLVLQEYADNVFDYDPSLHSVLDTAPYTSLPDPHEVAAPGGLTVSETLYSTVGDVIRTRATFNWAGPANAYATQYQVAHWGADDVRKSTTTTYTSLSIDDVQPGMLFGAVRARNSFGVWSEWSSVVARQILGKTEPPPDPDYFRLDVTGNGSRRFVFWIDQAPLDLAGFQIRYNVGAAALAWEAQTPVHARLLKSSPFETGGFFDGTFTFTVRAVDTSGNFSTPGRSLTVTLTPPLNAVLLVSENAREGSWQG